MNQAIRATLVAATVLGAIVIPVSAGGVSTPSHNTPTLTDPERQAIVSRFATAFTHDDHAGIAANSAANITWTIPGTSAVSGERRGVNAVIHLADVLAQYELHISVQAFTFGTDTVAVELRDSGSHNGKTLDQDVVNVLTIRDGKIASADGNLANVNSFDAYFS
ncbi:MAG: hypothetical protein JWQ81_1398 [Amycolatopsis sp.]|nr:hypothetical protein [Amycolatopsis sp.]